MLSYDRVLKTTPLLFIALALVAYATVACSVAGRGDSEVSVKSTETSCDLSRATVDPGKLEVKVANAGQQMTEVYVYAPNGRSLGEVENVGVGSTASFFVDIGGGEYQVACKPGQVGDGIRSALRVTGPAASTASLDIEPLDRATDRGSDGFSLSVTLDDAGCAFTPGVVVVKGQTITFEVSSSGAAAQPFKMLAQDGSTVAELPAIPPGSTATTHVTFTALGIFRCVGANADGANSSLEVID